MARFDALGKFHWHPEFRHLDYHPAPYVPQKFRPEGKKKYFGYNKGKVVYPPIPEDEA